LFLLIGLYLFSFQSQCEINSSHRSVFLQVDLLHNPILTIFISETQRKLEISDVHWKPIMLCFKNLKLQKYIENQLECFVLNFDTSDILWQCKLDAPNAAERSATQIGFPILKNKNQNSKSIIWHTLFNDRGKTRLGDGTALGSYSA